jgi:hypothetical protein
VGKTRQPNHDGNGNCIYKYKNINVYAVSNGYIIHNTAKPFEEGHSHINNFHLSKLVAKCVCKEKVLEKGRLSESVFLYLLVSITRLCTDEQEDYKNYIQGLIDARKKKGKKDTYMNPQPRGRN